MKNLVKSMAGTVSGFIRSTFFDQQERVFTSAQSPAQLLESLQGARVDWSDNVAGLCGSLRGDKVRLRWSPGFMRRTSPWRMFCGRVEPAPEGSRLRGHFATPLFLQCFMAVWMGLITLFAIVTVWTLVLPVACFLLLWLAALFWGTSARHAEEGLLEELQRICGTPPAIEE